MSEQAIDNILTIVMDIANKLLPLKNEHDEIMVDIQKGTRTLGCTNSTGTLSDLFIQFRNLQSEFANTCHTVTKLKNMLNPRMIEDFQEAQSSLGKKHYEINRRLDLVNTEQREMNSRVINLERRMSDLKEEYSKLNKETMGNFESRLRLLEFLSNTESNVTKEDLKKPIEEIDEFTVRIVNALHAERINTVGDLIFYNKPINHISNIGRLSLQIINDVINKYKGSAEE